MAVRRAVAFEQRRGNRSSRLRVCPTLSGHQGAYGRKPCAIWVVPRLYYSRPMERSVGRLFSSHSQEVVSISIAHRLNGLFAAYCVDFPCNPPRIAAENRLVCGQKFSSFGAPCLRKQLLSIIWEDTMKELAKQYDPSQVEDRIYQSGWMAATSTPRPTPTRNPTPS